MSHSQSNVNIGQGWAPILTCNRGVFTTGRDPKDWVTPGNSNLKISLNILDKFGQLSKSFQLYIIKQSNFAMFAYIFSSE